MPTSRNYLNEATLCISVSFEKSYQVSSFDVKYGDAAKAVGNGGEAPVWRDGHSHALALGVIQSVAHR